jgi:aspartyl protease family protein
VNSRGPIWLWLAIAATGLVGLLFALSGRFPGTLDDEGNLQRLVYLLGLLALVGGGLVFAIRRQPLRHLRYAAIWAGIGLVLVVGYSFRDELGPRLMGELVPTRGVDNGDGSVSFRAGADGYFQVDARVNGSLVRFLVDTGASRIVLSPADARRLGFDPDNLAFTEITETANGLGRSAPVILDDVEVGGLRVADVAASVNQTEMSRSLLGMSFLRRIGGFEVSGDRLTLRP